MKLTISPRRLIYWQIIASMVVKLITQIIPSTGVLEYGIDIVNAVLLFFLIQRLTTKKSRRGYIRYVTIAVVLMLVYDIIRAFITRTNIILFLWGVRNQYRFLLLFLCVATFWSLRDFEKFFRICYRLLLVNVVVITVQFASGYRGDYLGGTFGLEKNVNAITNVFLCMMTIYSVIWNVHKKMPRKELYIVLLASVYWAALAEIKIFFVELFVIIAVMFFSIHGHSMSKIKLAGSIMGFLGIGLIVLFISFPEQVAFIVNLDDLLWYAINVKGGANGFGRFTAIGIINRVFFDNDLLLKIFGIGLGNAEFLKVGGMSITSSFYDRYSIYSYFGYFHAVTYIDRGVLGLIWYLLFWLFGCLENHRAKGLQAERRYTDFTKIFMIIVVIVALKDSTLRVSISGYLVSIMMALPYVACRCSRQQRLED